MLIDECGLPAELPARRHRQRRHGRQRDRRPPRHRAHHLHRFAATSAGASVPGRRASASGSSSATTRRSSSSPTATGRRPRRKIKVAGFSHAGQSCISTQRIYVHRSIADDFTAALVEHVNSLVVGDPLDEATDVSALISTARARPGRRRGSTRPRPAAPRCVTGGDARRRRRAAPDGAHRRHARHEGVLARRSSARSSAIAAVRRPRRGARAGQRLRRSACRRRSSPPTSARRCEAVHTLDYGGVLVNEVPDVAGRPAALRRPARQRQHPRGPGLLGQGDDRDQDGRARRMMRWGVFGGSSRIYQERVAAGVR